MKVTLTSTSGATKQMNVDTKEHLLEFIELYKATLHVGQAVCVDAPLVGIHNGWIQGSAPKIQIDSVSPMGTLFFYVWFLYPMYHTRVKHFQEVSDMDSVLQLVHGK